MTDSKMTYPVACEKCGSLVIQGICFCHWSPAHPAPVADAESERSSQFLPTEDGEFNGNYWEGDLTDEDHALIDDAWSAYKGTSDAGHAALSHRLQQILDHDQESKIFDIRRDTISEIVTALRARTAHPVGVRVRKLDWNSDPFFQDEKSTVSASSAFGRYYVAKTDGGPWIYWGPGIVVSTGHETEEAAKAAAQADYEQRILSALLPEGGATCRKCGGEMRPGIAIGQTYVGGLPDFPGDDEAITLSAGGPGQLIGAMKCSACGWSVTEGGE